MIAYLFLRNEHEEETGRVEFTGGELIGDLVECVFDSIEEIQLTDEDASYYGVIYIEYNSGTSTYIRVDFDGCDTLEDQIERFTEDAIEYLMEDDEEEYDEEPTMPEFFTPFQIENICKMMREGA